MNNQSHSGFVCLPRSLSWLADAVVILTSCKEENHLLDGCGLGASRYVPKPVVFKKFAAATKELRLYWLVMNGPPPRKQKAA